MFKITYVIVNLPMPTVKLDYNDHGYNEFTAVRKKIKLLTLLVPFDYFTT